MKLSPFTISLVIVPLDKKALVSATAFLKTSRNAKNQFPQKNNPMGWSAVLSCKEISKTI